MINWIYFPKSEKPPQVALDVIEVFNEAESELKARAEEAVSNVVLSIVRPGLEELGFEVEKGKKAHQKIKVPVLFGLNGNVEKAFEADAWNHSKRMVLEVEAGRGVANNQFLKDLFQACMMQEVDYCGIAVRNKYINSRDFDRALSFFETLYASQRLKLPLKGVLLIGYSIRDDEN